MHSIFILTHSVDEGTACIGTCKLTESLQHFQATVVLPLDLNIRSSNVEDEFMIPSESTERAPEG